MWTAGTIPKNMKRAQSMSRTLRSNNSEFRKEQIGLNTSVERPAFSNPPLNEAAVMARAPSRQIPTCSQLLPEVDPLQHRVQRRTQRLTPRRETVFHLGRYFRIGLTHDDAVPRIPRVPPLSFCGTSQGGGAGRPHQTVARPFAKLNRPLRSATKVRRDLSEGMVRESWAGI